MSLFTYFKRVPKEKEVDGDSLMQDVTPTSTDQPPLKRMKCTDESEVKEKKAKGKGEEKKAKDKEAVKEKKAEAPKAKKKRKRKKKAVKKKGAQGPKGQRTMTAFFKRMQNPDDPSVKGQTLLTKFFSCSNETEGKFEYLFQREKARQERLKAEAQARVMAIREEERKKRAEARAKAKAEKQRLFVEDQRRRRKEEKLKKQGKTILADCLTPASDVEEPSMECGDGCVCATLGSVVEQMFISEDSYQGGDDLLVGLGGASGTLYLGNRLGASNAKWMYKANVTAVLNVTRDIKNYFEDEPLLPTMILDEEPTSLVDDGFEPAEDPDAKVDDAMGTGEEEDDVMEVEKPLEDQISELQLKSPVKEKAAGKSAETAVEIDDDDDDDDDDEEEEDDGEEDDGEGEEESEEEEEESDDDDEEEYEEGAEDDEKMSDGEEGEVDPDEKLEDDMIREAMVVALKAEMDKADAEEEEEEEEEEDEMPELPEEAEVEEDFSDAKPIEVDYLRIVVSDATEEPLSKYFDEAIAYLVRMLEEEKRSVLVHCREGMSRSPTIVIAYLMKVQRWSLLRAYHHVLKCNRTLRINDGFKRQLMLYDEKLFGKVSKDFFNKRTRGNTTRSACGSGLGKRARRSATPVKAKKAEENEKEVAELPTVVAAKASRNILDLTAEPLPSSSPFASMDYCEPPLAEDIDL